MNNLVKVTSRLVRFGNFNVTNAFKHKLGKRDFARGIWHMSQQLNDGKVAGLTTPKPSMGCSCGCGGKFAHTKGERELVEFLTEEILAEKKTQKGKPILTSLEGFNVEYDGADITLTKAADKEKVVINMNVNHTVDTEEQPEINPNANKPDVLEMRSKPQFEVDVVRGDITLSFTCSYLEGTPEEGEYNDIFGIDEVCIYEKEWSDKVYAVAGDVLDGYLYDLLMNFLEEKGVSNEFAEKLSDLATAFEHNSYIGLLEKISKFTTGK